MEGSEEEGGMTWDRERYQDSLGMGQGRIGKARLRGTRAEGRMPAWAARSGATLNTVDGVAPVPVPLCNAGRVLGAREREGGHADVEGPIWTRSAVVLLAHPDA